MFIPFHDDNPTVRTPVVTLLIIALNVVSFAWLIGLPPEQSRWVQWHRGFVPARIAQCFQPKLLQVPVAEVVPGIFGGEVLVQRHVTLPPARGEILLALFTCMFLHGGWMHLIGNMWFLWLFGNNVEDRLGPARFCVLYLLGGLLASGCHWVTAPSSTAPVIGASGAVAAVLGAYAITWPWARVHTLVFLFVFITTIDLPALLVLGVWFLGQVLSGTQQLETGAAGGVAWWAHIGGFLAGMILMPLFGGSGGTAEWQTDTDESGHGPQPCDF
jgi:hypothetical protein